jgi:PhzF family phenazine biosynthesis protein
MTNALFIVNAFTKGPFTGNPAAVCPLINWLPDKEMQLIAMQNNLSETVFFVKNTDETYHIRWFTPTIEVDLCGHATLAASHILFAELGYSKNELTFNSRSGLLKVRKEKTGYQLDFPSDTIIPIPEVVELSSIFGTIPIAVCQGSHDLIVEFDTEEMVKYLNPDYRQMKALPYRGIIATAKSEQVDFVSRCFYPAAGIDEDPATGSAHTTLTPYWHQKTNRTDFTAHQLSQRGGFFQCVYQGDRILISGSCQLYSRAEIYF